MAALMTEREFYELVKTSHAYLAERQNRLKSEFKIASYENFDWNQETGLLVFSDDKRRPQVTANFEFVGTLAKDPSTWRWAWANDSLVPQMKHAVQEVRRFGEAHDLPPLVQEQWEADEGDAWDMTALAVNLLQAQGAYRAPGANGLSLLVLTRLTWAEVAA